MTDLIISTGMLSLRLLIAAVNNDTNSTNNDYNISSTINFTSYGNNTNSSHHNPNGTINSTTTLEDDIENYFDLMSRRKGWALAAMASIVLILCIGCSICSEISDDNDNDNDNDEHENNNNNNNNNGTTAQQDTATTTEEDASYAAKIEKMTAEERIHLFNEAFDKNKNQIVLTPAHIIVHDHHHEKGAGNDDGEQHDNNDFGYDDGDDDDDDCSLYLALEDARAHLQSSLRGQTKAASSNDMNSSDVDNNNNNNNNIIFVSKRQDKKERSRKGIIHPRGDGGSNVSDGGGDGSEGPSTTAANTTHITRTMFHGDCVICFEDMEAGDQIVWSESKSCPHVYHKVSYKINLDLYVCVCVSSCLQNLTK